MTDPKPLATLQRRDFLRVSALGSGALVFGGTGLLTACDPVLLVPAPGLPDILVAPFFSARIVATTGEEVADTGYTWHRWPDGGACFPTPYGGWSYVSNSEWFVSNEGGAGASFIRFFSDGALYKFLPDTWGDLGSGTLQVLTEPQPGQFAWVDVPDPNGQPTETRYQVPDTKHFDGGEGIDIAGGRVVFTTKGDNRVWAYDPVDNTLEIIYDVATAVNGILSGVDNLEVSSDGVIYVCEDGGDMQIVLVREDGATFPVIQILNNSGSELCGAAFDPSGKRLYFSDQRNPGRTIEVKGPWRAFTAPGPLPI